MRDLKGRHLLLAGTAAAALHVGALALIFLAPASEGASGDGGMGGLGGIEIGLADLSGTTGSAPPIQDSEAPSETMAEPVTPELVEAEAEMLEQAEVLPPEPEPVPENAQPIVEAPEPVLAETLPDLIPIETLEAEAVEPEPVEPEPEKPEPEIVKAEDPEPEQQESEVEMVESAPVPMPRPDRPEPVQERKPEPEPQPERQPEPAPQIAEKPEPEPASPFASEAPELDSWSQAALPGANAQTSDHLPGSGAGSAAPEAGAGGGGAPGAPGAPGNNAAQSDFRAEIAAWISRHKRYPRRARAQGIEGMGVLRFAMDRSGNVLSAEVAQ
ncbi:MAG TPA: hypothetical protein VK090_07875, partial [Paracoccaceae bacterium]|nr:hypothetical protein [Paracoccaceae bacterium]